MASKCASTQSRLIHRELWIDGVKITDRVLGKGAYGEVVEVIWNGTSCAGKRVHQLLIGKGSHVVQSFKRECETWSKLRHPNVAQFLGLFYETRVSHSERNLGDTLPMIVVEKMDTTLRRLMEDTMREKLPTSVRVDILCQVTRGMVYLHNQSPSVVHRDLTPNNILVNTDSLAVKLSDFGVAKVIQPHTNSMTSVPGTPHFMPPEVFAKGNTVGSDLGSRIDVFSFGVLIVFVIVHKWPEPAPNVMQEKGNLIALNEVERREAYINQFTTEEKKHFLDTVHRCLSYDPQDRPSSSDLLKAMESLAQLDQYRLRKVPVLQQSVLVNEKETTLEVSLHCSDRFELISYRIGPVLVYLMV